MVETIRDPATRDEVCAVAIAEAFRGDGGGKGLRKGSRLTQVRYDGIVARCHPGDLWQADHIRAVMHGGGQATSAAQYQTLCTPCHLEKTRRERGGKKSQIINL